ncbi:peptidase [Aureococcus anophagefferens]|nr:peptidase [Aureococcus anophagefferens]
MEFAATPEVAVLDVVDGEPRTVCGTFELYKEVGKSGGPTYYCQQNRLYLYERSPGAWVVGKKSGGKSCKAYNGGEATVVGGWSVYHEKRWCRYGNIAGGYVACDDRAENGRPVYHNAEDGKDLWYGPERRWLFGDAAGLDASGAYASYFGSAPTDAFSPERADWSAVALTVHPCEPPSAGDAAGAGDEDVDDGGFHDPDFVAGPASLNEPSVGGASWIRASKLHGPDEEVHLWDGVEPSDIMQGALGDCWLLCALSAVAEFPGFVEEALFETKAPTADGRYSLRLYDARLGDFASVVVDDLVPCGPKKWWEAPRPLFSQPHGNEMYILLIEKAFAKLAGPTGSCRAATRARALYARKTAEALGDAAMFDFLLHCDESNFIMAASITGDEIEKPRDDGLVERHAYSLIRVAAVGDVRLVQARNPWGNSTEWNGAWSDKAPQWRERPDVAAALGYAFADDGLFWMDWVDFKATFDAVQVCARPMDAKRGDFGAVARALDDGTGALEANAAVAAAPPVFAAAPPVAPPRRRRIAAKPEAAPDGPPHPDWEPTRLGISYKPSRLAIEYTTPGGAAYRKLIPVVPADAGDSPETVLGDLQEKFGDFLDFDAKLSRTQTLKLVEMLCQAR